MTYKEKQKMFKNLYRSLGNTLWVSKTGKNNKGQTYITPGKLKLKLMEQQTQEKGNK